MESAGTHIKVVQPFETNGLHTVRVRFHDAVVASMLEFAFPRQVLHVEQLIHDRSVIFKERGATILRVEGFVDGENVGVAVEERLEEACARSSERKQNETVHWDASACFPGRNQRNTRWLGTKQTGDAREPKHLWNLGTPLNLGTRIGTHCQLMLAAWAENVSVSKIPCCWRAKETKSVLKDTCGGEDTCAGEDTCGREDCMFEKIVDEKWKAVGGRRET